jgi:hypothetical protein
MSAFCSVSHRKTAKHHSQARCHALEGIGMHSANDSRLPYEFRQLTVGKHDSIRKWSEGGARNTAECKNKKNSMLSKMAMINRVRRSERMVEGGVDRSECWVCCDVAGNTASPERQYLPTITDVTAQQHECIDTRSYPAA